MTPQHDSSIKNNFYAPLAFFFGALLLAGAIALPLYAVPALKKIPLDFDLTTSAPTVNETKAKLFDRCSLTGPKAMGGTANLTQQSRALVVAKSDASVATFQVGHSVLVNQFTTNEGKSYRPRVDAPTDGGCKRGLWTATVDFVTINRQTGLPERTGRSELQLALGATHKSSEKNASNEVFTGTDFPYRRQGSIVIPNRQGFNYFFSFGMKATGNYQLFDTTTQKSYPLKYRAEEEVQGREVLHFEQQVPDTDLSALVDNQGKPLPDSSLTKPRSWFGLTSQGNTPARAVMHYRATRNLFVDKATGVIINQRQSVNFYYQIPHETKFSLTYLAATFTNDQRSQRQAAVLAAELNRPLVLWGRVAPLCFGISGLIILIGGIVYLRRQIHAAPKNHSDVERG